MTQKDMLKLSKAYKAGEIPEEIIKKIEKANNRSIEEIVASIDNVFEYKRHRIETMTITDIRKWVSKKKISDEEKKLYADANKCTYEEALNKAKERLEEHEINTEFKRLDSLYGLTPETRERKRKYRQWLLDNGIGELSPDGDGVIMVETDRLLKALEQEGEIISRKMSKKQKN